jgi:hypothetical protein
MSSLMENSLSVNASKPYLMGDMYYSHATQPGILPELVMNPPNIARGINIRGES